MLFPDLIIPLSFRGKYNKYRIIKSKIAMLLMFSTVEISIRFLLKTLIIMCGSLKSVPAFVNLLRDFPSLNTMWFNNNLNILETLALWILLLSYGEVNYLNKKCREIWAKNTSLIKNCPHEPFTSTMIQKPFHNVLRVILFFTMFLNVWVLQLILQSMFIFNKNTLS